MRYIRKLILPTLLLILLHPSTSFALLCSGNGGTFVLPRGLAIGADLEDGTIAWESETFSRSVTCKTDGTDPGIITDQIPISIYVNPKNHVIDGGIEVGMRFNGKIYTRAGEKIPTGIQTEKVCGIDGIPGMCERRANFTLDYSIVVIKRGVFPPSGQATQVAAYTVFTVDREKSLSARQMFNPTVYNLQLLRSSACTPTLNIVPDHITFPMVHARDAQRGKVASAVDFNLEISRTCSRDLFTSEAKFTPVTATDAAGMLVPDDNPSVGISLVRADNRTKAPFNKWFNLHSASYREVVRVPFRADLIWREDQPKVGPFNAAVVVELIHY
ncbi:fimbrial protein [Pseudomonas sp. D(2018)]|uniref:fimbrial protein n=1 Tax=Pseudomonadaceae TaxID=135621 RepID=UPI0014858959|nr:fimbrial protein [Pseudomonas sp. D(2018)]